MAAYTRIRYETVHAFRKNGNDLRTVHFIRIHSIYSYHSANSRIGKEGKEVKGLIIKDPWITKILNGEKVWEIRGSNTKIRGTISLIKSGTGMIYGTVNIVDSMEIISIGMWDRNINNHCVEILPKEYKRCYAWVLENPMKYVKAIPYKHKPGCVIWINL